MSASGTHGKVFIVDTNLFFVKRLSEALRQKGFEVVHCSEAAYALTMIEWNMPVAILCASNGQNPNGFEIPTILRADAKTSHIPVIALGDRGQQSQLGALRAGYEDFVDRRLGAEEIASHLISFLASHKDGFKPTQMLTRAETALDGRLSLVDLPGVIQMLDQSRQTGALHVNSAATEGIIFFNTGEAIHAESGLLAGDDAIVCLIKKCHGKKDGVYKFIPGGAPTLRTVHCNLNGLIMDALRELDEEERDKTLLSEPLDDSFETEPEPVKVVESLIIPDGPNGPNGPDAPDAPKRPGGPGAPDIGADVDEYRVRAFDEESSEMKEETHGPHAPVECIFAAATVTHAMQAFDQQLNDQAAQKEETYD
jgi:CheY-like chemotaxis protein